MLITIKLYNCCLVNILLVILLLKGARNAVKRIANFVSSYSTVFKGRKPSRIVFGYIKNSRVVLKQVNCKSVAAYIT